MFDYMTEIETIEVDDDLTRTIKVKAHDMDSLLYAFMDECLFKFNADRFAIYDMDIDKFDTENWEIEAVTYGELFDLAKHPQGTKVKAITYSAMQIVQHDAKDGGGAEVWVIVDI